MRRYFIILTTLLLLYHISAVPSLAVVDPLAQPNNKFGIHILFPNEIDEAASLVNSNNGDWGYVVIPIQAGDMDVPKWQQFMDMCKQKHIIPILRLATEGDYFNTSVWRKPDAVDILDFANFLNSLSWPVKNRYVIVFNEVNRADEFGGVVDPASYAKLLSYAVTVFKSINPDFFIIPAGMDNAAANTPVSMNEYDYFRAMHAAVPGIFNQIDGLASHSYPNPGFAQAPSVINGESIASFQFEKNLIQTMTNKQLPVFITETGWSTDSIPGTVIANYYQQAFSTIWNNPYIVTVAPFLIQANSGPFVPFSFITAANAQTPEYTTIASMPKVKGSPVISSKVLGEATTKVKILLVQNFTHVVNNVPQIHIASTTKEFFKWLLGL